MSSRSRGLRRGTIYEACHRSTKTADEGRRVFGELLQTADAVVQTSKPGSFARIGVDYDSVAALKPDIIYVEMSAFGQTGPWRTMPAHGYNMLATTNRVAFEWVDGRPEFPATGPLKPGGGGMGGGSTAALATLAAIIQRAKTGQGQYIDVSFWDEMVSVQSDFRDWLNGVPAMMDALDIRHSPRYNVYGTSDHKVIFIGPIEPHFWRNFCNVIGKPEWIPRARFEMPMDHGNYDVELRGMIQAELCKRSLDEWLSLFLENDVPASPVLESEKELESAEHLASRVMITEFEHEAYGRYRSLRPGFLVPDETFTVKYPAPMLGDHTEEILIELGYNSGQQDELRQAGIV
jgi:crotonobetainyl-CoA:carnitine CoA-transferase CaiB-like acyl-CoA transferase